MMFKWTKDIHLHDKRERSSELQLSTKRIKLFTKVVEEDYLVDWKNELK